MSRILVTGGAGFIGSHVALELVKKHNVFPIDDLSSTGNWDNLKFYSRLASVGANTTSILDVQHLSELMKSWKIDTVVHLAAQPSLQESLKNAPFDAQTNIIGTINLLGLCQRYKVKKFIFASTSAVYAPRADGWYSEDDLIGPQNPYGVSKAAAEYYIRISGIPYTILRLGNVYGPRQVPLGENQLIPRALAHIYQGEPFEVYGDGKQIRSFVYVEDVAKAFVKAVEGNARGTFNIAGGVGLAVNVVLKKLWRLIPYTMYWHHGPPKPGELHCVCLDVGKADYSPLGWKAETSLRSGLAKTVEAWPK